MIFFFNLVYGEVIGDEGVIRAFFRITGGRRGRVLLGSDKISWIRRREWYLFLLCRFRRKGKVLVVFGFVGGGGGVEVLY